MSLQTIINKAESIQIDRRKVVGVQYTRSEVAKVTETATKNPWRMSVQVSAMFPYAENRSLMESIDNLDRTTSEVVTFSNNANLSWMFAYQGSMSSTQISACRAVSFTGNTLVLGTLPSTPAFPSGNYLFKAGDIIQIGSSPYPFTVTADVTRGSGSTVNIPLHRPNILSSSVSGVGITVGNGVSFKMFCPNMPTYTIVAGRYVQFNSDFQLYEDLGAA